MRSADFKRTESKIRVLQEVRPKKGRINWDRAIYFVLLISAMVSILFFLARNNLFVRAEGQVLFRKLDIQFTQDVQIVEFTKAAGDKVRIGDTLFMYHDEAVFKRPVVDKVTPVIHTTENLEWIERERIDTRKKIELAKLRVKDFQRLSQVTISEKNRVEQEIFLDVYPASKLDPYVHRLIQYDGGEAAAYEDIRFQEQYLHWLRVQEGIERRQLALRNKATPAELPVLLQAYISPVNGFITQIFKEDFEVALESDIVMSVHKPTNLFIQAFYDQKFLKHLREGDLVDVKFPDGTHSKGIIERFYGATYQLPSEFQKTYEPVTRSIAADITPINEIELEKWKAFYKLNVHISKPLIPFLEYGP